MIKATTEHGTYYLIDNKSGKAMRVKAEDRNDMYDDGEWFDFLYYCSVDRDKWKYGDNGEIEIGKSIFFALSRPFGDWRISTDVVSVEEV